jgi:adenylate cyclase
MAETTPSQTSPRRHIFIILGIAFILIVMEVWGNYPDTATSLERLELAAGDASLWIRGRTPPNEDIVIVAFDDKSLAEERERWPWPRSEFAQIVNWLNEAGAKVIALDVLLFDESADPAEDQALAEALNNANVAVSVNQIFTSKEPGGSSVTNYLPEEMFLEVLDGYGISEVDRDDDAIVRGIKAFEIYQDEIYYNWTFEIVRVYLDIDPPSNTSEASMTFNGQEIPLNRQNKMLVNFAGGSQTYPYCHAAPSLLGSQECEKDKFKDKIVLIGATSETLQDLYPTPFSATNLTPGVEVVANAVATVLSGEFYRIAPPWVSIVMILIGAAAAWFIVKIPRPTLTIGLMVGGIVGYFTLRQIIFLQTGWQFAIVSPLLTLFLGVVVPTLEQAVTQEVEKRRIRSLFSRFISPEMVTQLLETQDITSLNKRTELTILFSDIRGFTTISEKLAPLDVVSLLNPYLEVMSAVIHKHGGTVDKYEGDAIVAFFGEPIPYQDHAVRATRASLEMRQALKELTEEWKAEGRFTESFEMGIGLNTGEVFVGLVGSEQRVNYTVIGDTANLAARLQDQTKELGYPILISGETHEKVKEEFQVEFVTSRILKGKSEPVQIYRLVIPGEEVVEVVEEVKEKRRMII